MQRATTLRATMKDVAQRAGVSLKTVSRVINNERTVNAEMQRRVLGAVEELRYQPNMGARALRRLDGRSSTIGVLLEDLANPFSATIFRAIEEIAGKRGVSVLGGSLDEDADWEYALTASLSRHRVDGLVLVPASPDHQYLEREKDAGMPIVFIDRPPVHLDVDCVLSDSRDGARGAVRHLLDLGHRRIAYLGDKTTIPTAQERFTGYADALKEFGVALDTSIIATDLRTIDASHAATSILVNDARPPSAFFAGQNLVTIGVVRALRQFGVQHTTALVGFDDFLLADLLEPGVTVVAQDVVNIGREAARILFERIDGDESVTKQVVIPTRLIPRGSGEIAPSR